MPFYQELQTHTGVKLEFTNPHVGQKQEAFNVLLASGELSDVIEWDWRMFPGGPTLCSKLLTEIKAINEFP